MTANPPLYRLQGLAGRVCRRGFVRTVAQTAGINIASTVAAGIGGVIIARTLGPTLRGDYAAVTAWFGITLMVGGMGQPAALCFYVARDPTRAKQYVATSRAMMLVTGAFALAAGLLLAPVLAHQNASLTASYRIAFAASIIAFVGAAYTFSLQARDMRQWNLVRLSQPALAVVAVALLWRLRILTLESALIVMVGTMIIQLCYAYFRCRSIGLAPGHASATLVRPLTAYGAAQIAALTPAALNAQLDQLVLSQTVSAADLGRYAVAVSLSMLPIPVVSAIGNVAFPHLAAQSGMTRRTRRLQRLAVLYAVLLTAGLLVPFSLAAYWLVPMIFGSAYRDAVPLLWILTPGAVFLGCGQVVGDLLRGRNRPAAVAWAQGFAAFFTVALLLALLPIIGVYGAAVASTVAYGIALVAMLRSLRHTPHHARRRRDRMQVPAS